MSGKFPILILIITILCFAVGGFVLLSQPKDEMGGMMIMGGLFGCLSIGFSASMG